MKSKKHSVGLHPELKFASINKVCNSTNGLDLNNVYFPEEVILHILSFVDPKRLLQHCLVCRKWNKLIKSYTLWSSIYTRRYNRKPKQLPWYVYCCLLSTKCFDINLLRNGNGQDGLKYWNCTMWEEDNYVEDPPNGTDPLPADIPEFNNCTSCFATSYFTGYKNQEVQFPMSKLFRYILNVYKPYIYVSEWTTSRLDCTCEYVMECKFLGCHSSVSYDKPSVKYCKSQWAKPTWKKIELLITEYPEEITGLLFEHNGHNLQSWRGHFGVKMAGGVVKIVFDSIEPLATDEHGGVITKGFKKVQVFSPLDTDASAQKEEMWDGEYDEEIYYYMP